MDRKALDLTVDDRTLTILGHRKEEFQPKEEDYDCSERWSGSFLRSLSLPAAVDVDRIEATFTDGVLVGHEAGALGPRDHPAILRPVGAEAGPALGRPAQRSAGGPRGQRRDPRLGPLRRVGPPRAPGRESLSTRARAARPPG